MSFDPRSDKEGQVLASRAIDFGVGDRKGQGNAADGGRGSSATT
jgi:hypothetical protein